ncbi:MAG: SWIM zinc finger family protein [Phycisphaerae bacterium]
MWWRFRPYVSVGERRQNAQREVAKLARAGRKISPVLLEGRTIADTFWGKAWCKHLESYSDYANRLPRGRSYLRNGSVLDLQIEPGKISALVSGSEVYTVGIKIKPLAREKWASVRQRLSGEISSIIELLRGRMSDAVMAVVTDRDNGLFPAPDQIDMDCSCPDSAGLCKHLAAVLYGVGARLDTQPELLFKLRKVNHLELVPTAATVGALTSSGKAGRKTIAGGELGDVFGVEMDQPLQTSTAAATTQPRQPVKTSRNIAADKKQLPALQTQTSRRLRNKPKSVVAKSAVRSKTAKIAKKNHAATTPRRKRR